MENQKFVKMMDGDIIDSIRNITADASKLKNAVFKNAIMKEDVDEDIFVIYLNSINRFLKFWDDYANDLQIKIKSSNGIVGINTISYDRVKDFIYSKYDYASILPFTDGIIKGISSGKFKTPEDIEDFRDHTISKAFNGEAASSAALVDSVLIYKGSIGSMNALSKTTPLEAKSFDSIKNYNMFDRRSRPELYKAISKVIDFLTRDINVGKFLTISNIKLFVSTINNIVDYMTYSLTAYACRIYIISLYAYPFIENDVYEYTSVVESAHDDIGNKSGTMIFRNVDEMICRDPSKTREFINIFSDFITSIGADSLFETRKPLYNTTSIDDSSLENNVFCQKLTVNALHEFLSKPYMYYNTDDISSKLDELNSILHELIYNSSQGIQGVSSPKQELLHVIRGTSCDDTVNGYRSLAKDLYLCAFQLCGRTERIINYLIRWKKRESEDPNHNTAALNNAAECIKIISEFYRDLSTAIVQKVRDIEMHINSLSSNDVDKVVSGLSIKVPDSKFNVSSNDNMMTSVPDTTRIPTELLDLYDVPTFEYMEMYNEYVRNLPGMENDLYYSEAFNISAIIDKIISGIRSAWKRFEQFWNDKRVQAAVKWIYDHEKEFLSMDFSTAKINAMKYKVNIGFPKGFERLHNGLQSFTPENIKTKEASDKYIRGLYPDGVYEWFADQNNKDGKLAATKYRNYILFYDLNEVKEEQPQQVQLNGQQIQRAVPEWIKTVKSVKEALDGYTAKGKELEAGINKIKSRVASLTDTSNDNKSETPEMTQASPSDGNQKPATTPATNGSNDSGNKATEAASESSLAVTEIQLAVDRIYKSLSPIFIEYIQAMYGYLKEVYSMAKKN